MATTVENIEKLDVLYDKEGGVIYLSFGEPREADESKLTENDIIVRYKHGTLVGLTVLSFSKGPMREK